MVLPPEGERFFVIDSLTSDEPHSRTFNFELQKKKICLGVTGQMPLPQLLYFVLVLRSGGPQTVLDSFVDIIIVAASNHNARHIIFFYPLEGWFAV